MDDSAYKDRIAMLKEMYPYMFRDVHDYMVSINKGWLKIIEKFCFEVDKTLSAAEKESFVFGQIKEKFGDLRIYYQCGQQMDDEKRQHIRALYEAASEEASRTCQRCGAPGKMNNRSGWMATLCERHKKHPDED